MISSEIEKRGIVLLGCGKMGSAMLAGWLDHGLSPSSVWVLDPKPSDWVQSLDIHLNEKLPSEPAVVLTAVKPQMMGEALPRLQKLGGANTMFLSIAAGTPISFFEDVLGRDTPIIRAMPNTPAAVNQGITAICGNGRALSADLEMAEGLLTAIGDVIRVDNEAQIDAVTGVSGSGPAYVFYMIDCMTQAGIAEGLSEPVAKQLALKTVQGAGALALQSDDTPEQLRVNVTSPNGTTQAGLEVLMNPETGLEPLIKNTVGAATQRAKELGNG